MLIRYERIDFFRRFVKLEAMIQQENVFIK